MAYDKHIPIQLTMTSGSGTWTTNTDYYSKVLQEIRQVKAISNNHIPYDPFPPMYYKNDLGILEKVDDCSDIEEI